MEPTNPGQLTSGTANSWPFAPTQTHTQQRFGFDVLRGKVVVALRFKEDCIEQKRSTNKHSLLIRSGIIREANFKRILRVIREKNKVSRNHCEFAKHSRPANIACRSKQTIRLHTTHNTYRIGKDFCHHGFGFFENLAQIGCVSSRGTLLSMRVHTKGHFATTLAKTRIALGATIDATTATTRGSVHNVQVVALVIRNGEDRYTKVASLLDGTQSLTTRRKLGGLVAATFAGTGCTGTRSFHGQEFSFRIVFLDRHGESAKKIIHNM